MEEDVSHVLHSAYPGEGARYFLPMSIGSAPEHADKGAALILNGTKTLTSSASWDYPDGVVPFVGALSLLLDGAKRPRGIVETIRVQILRFGAVTDEMAQAYGEGDRTVEWWLREMGAYYRTSAARHGATFSNETPLIWEWFVVTRRF